MLLLRILIAFQGSYKIWNTNCDSPVWLGIQLNGTVSATALILLGITYLYTAPPSDWMMDDLLFYVLANSISVVSGRWEGDDERLCAVESKRFPLPAGLEPGSARSMDQTLTYWAIGAPTGLGI